MILIINQKGKKLLQTGCSSLCSIQLAVGWIYNDPTRCINKTAVTDHKNKRL